MEETMRTFAFLVFAALVAIASPAPAANEYGTKDEAVAMVKRVQAEFKKDGADATFKAVSDKAVAEYHDRDLYPFIYDMTGKCVAHGGNAALIGKDLIGLKDPDGTYMVKALVGVQDAGWINYKWPDPATKKIEPKVTYVIHVGDYYVGVGAYKVQ
jgi:signal transduction histidine kinase